MPTGEPLFCFTSNRIDIHPCLNCRGSMTLVCSNTSRSSSAIRTFHCFNCGSGTSSKTKTEGVIAT
jgi:hypothetical protein